MLSGVLKHTISMKKNTLPLISKFVAPTMYTKSQVQQYTTGLSVASVQHDPMNSIFFIKLGDHKAFVEYSLVGNVMQLNHTVVPEVFGGKGVGKVLAEAALDHCVREDLKAELICDFIQHYYQKYGSKYESIVVKNL